MVSGEFSMLINTDLDIVRAREKGKWLAREIGFNGSELTLLSTLISELARKVIALDCKGNVIIQSLQRGARKGIAISVTEASTNALGSKGSNADFIPLRDHLSQDERLVMLAGRHVTDEFEVRPNTQKGMIVRVVKWL